MRLDNFENGGETARAETEDEARHRLALTRVLIWAEREAASQGRQDVSEKLREVIATLHRDAG
ncbi:MAG: hypothetical protein ACQEUZ_04945 [Pseudomonadota bacterium]